MTETDLHRAKTAMREIARGERRIRAARGDADTAGRAAADLLLAAIPVLAGAVVAAYWPLADEFDPRPSMRALHERGHPLALPVVVGRGRPLVFRRWQPGDALVKATFGTQEPPPSAPGIDPLILLVPLLAFDRAGFRLGYGAGYYDRTLARLRAARPVVAIGLAFAVQEVESVPHGATDERLDWIVTEDKARRCA